MIRHHWFPKPYADVVARLRVPSSFLLVVAFGWLAKPDLESLAIGLPVAFAGLALRAWAAGCLAKNQNLATGGPYAYVRNPLYAGTLVVAAGLAIAARRWLLAGIFGAVFALVYLPVIEQEEQHLRKLFPEFAAYAERIPMLWPRLGTQSGGTAFSWRLYMRNQEYNALAGLLAGVLFLLWKAWR